MTLRTALALGGTLLPLWVAAQGISIQTPQLAPRGSAAQPFAPTPGAAHPGFGAQPQAPQQAPHGSQPGYGQQPGFEPQPGYGQQAGYGTSPAATAQAPQALASPMQQRRGAVGAYGQSQYGQQPGAGGAAPQVAMVAPTPSAPGGACRVQPSPDRQTMSLLGPDGQPRRHVPLGDFRVHQVVHSPDGLWAVALAKLRGEPQFAAVALDLTRCETANTVDLPSAGEDVRFEGDSAVVRMAQGERRVRLATPLVR